MGKYKYKLMKGDDNMDLKDFINQNKEKIRKLSEQNTKKNSKGEVVITKNDPWRNEVEWEQDFSILAGDNKV